MEQFNLRISTSVQNEIHKILSLNLEIESVGLLFGRKDKNQLMIKYFIEMENLESSRKSFSIDYSVLFQHIREFQTRGLDLVGFFHSHPKNSIAYPSNRDKQFMIYWPFPYIWLIGTNLGKFFAFIYQNDVIRQLDYSS
ncbi:MAG: M67 family metallopeptidase [Candidatus Hodarchaeales archaeon]|jgi:proteasome lid subunit RPN8/RPN11